MAEVTGDDNREGTGNSPDALTAMPCRESPGPRVRCPRARRADAQPSRVLRPAGGGRHRPRRVRIRRRDQDAAGRLRCHGKGIVFRTAPDTLLAVYADGQVSLEADHLDQAHREGWSVLVQGHAHTVTDEREVKRLEDRTHLEPWAGGARDVYVRITPARISGRCIEPGWASPLAPDTKAQAPLPEAVATG
jgi:hypothetical protein